MLKVVDNASVNDERHKVTQIVAVNDPPQAYAGQPLTVCPGTKVMFDGTASSDRDGTLIRYIWDFGQGTQTEGQTATQVFNEPGLYQVKLSVSDDSGSQCALAENVTSVRVNAPPLAVAGSDRTAWVGGAYDAILFDATQSQDPDQEPLTYEWDFGDGVIQTGAKVLHAYRQPGRYKVRLRVRDSSRLGCSEAWDEITVEARHRSSGTKGL